MEIKTKNRNFTIKQATIDDVPQILSLIRELAEYEKLSHEVVATVDILEESLFGEWKVAEAVLGHYDGKPVSFALFFHNFSTFAGRPGIYIEDIYVKPEMRGKGIGSIMFAYIARLACERKCARLEWSVLNWNEPAIKFYKTIGSVPMDEWTVHRVTGAGLEQLAERF